MKTRILQRAAIFAALSFALVGCATTTTRLPAGNFVANIEGKSAEPTYKDGASVIVVQQPVARLVPGVDQIFFYQRYPYPFRLVGPHRLIEILPSGGLVTKGDGNDHRDPVTPPSQYLGAAWREGMGSEVMVRAATEAVLRAMGNTEAEMRAALRGIVFTPE